MRSRSFTRAAVLCLLGALPIGHQTSGAYAATPGTNVAPPPATTQATAAADARRLLERHALRITSAPQAGQQAGQQGKGGERRGFSVVLNMADDEGGYTPVEMRVDFVGELPMLGFWKDGLAYLCVYDGLLLMATPRGIAYQPDTRFELAYGYDAKKDGSTFNCAFKSGREPSTVELDLGSVLRVVVDNAKQVTHTRRGELTFLGGSSRTVVRDTVAGANTTTTAAAAAAARAAFPVERIEFFDTHKSRHPRLVVHEFRAPVDPRAWGGAGSLSVEGLRTLNVPAERTKDLPPEARNPSWYMSALTRGGDDPATRKAAAEITKLLPAPAR